MKKIRTTLFITTTTFAFSLLNSCSAGLVVAYGDANNDTFHGIVTVVLVIVIIIGVVGLKAELGDRSEDKYGCGFLVGGGFLLLVIILLFSRC